MKKESSFTRKVTRVATASCLGIALLVGGGTYALWSANAPVNSSATVTTGDLNITSASAQTWSDISKPAAPVAIPSLANFLLVPGDTLQLKQDLNVVVVGNNISGVLNVTLPNSSASLALLAQAKFTITLLDKNNVQLATVTPTTNTANSLALNVSNLPTTTAAGDTYHVQINVALPAGADNDTKVQVGSLDGLVLTLNQGAPYVAPYPTATPAAQFTAVADGANGAAINAYSGSSKNIVIPETMLVGGVAKPVTSIRTKAFWNKGLTSVVMPDSITSLGQQAFQSNSLTAVKLPKHITYIGFAAFNANLLASINIPSSVTNIDSAAFSGNAITAVNLPSGLTNLGAIAFSNNKITSVVIPAGITVLQSQIFFNNPLTSVTLPSGVTSIGNAAFQGTTAMVSIYFKGNGGALFAPTDLPFGATTKAMVYHHSDATGFSNPWLGYPTTLY